MQTLRSGFAVHLLLDAGLHTGRGILRRQCSNEVANKTPSLTQLLQEVLGCSKDKARRIMMCHRSLRKLDATTLKSSVTKLKNLGVSPEDITENISLLTGQTQILQNRGMVLQEGGFSPISAGIIKRYILLVRTQISLIKSYGVLPDNVNVAESFLSYIEEPPPTASRLDLAKIVCNDKATFHDVHTEMIKHFMCWKLDMTQEEANNMLKNYKRIKHKSFRLMQQTLKLLQNDLGFTLEKIKKHGYLLSICPDNIMRTLNHFNTIAGMDIKELLSKYPKIMCSPTETLIKTLQHLQDFGISEEAIQKCPYVLTLGSESVKQRLVHLESNPEFSGFLNNPRVLQLVHYQRKAQARLNTLRDMKLNCVSLNLLSSGTARFERYIRDGSDRTRGSDTVEFLSAELKCDKPHIREALRRHPFWCLVPLSTVADTVKFLKSQDFKNADIVANIQVVLYNRNQLQKELSMLQIHPELKCEFTPIPMNYGMLKLSKKMQLALCLYFIERPHHFSGDGVWSNASTHAVQGVAMEEIAI